MITPCFDSLLLTHAIPRSCQDETKIPSPKFGKDLRLRAEDGLFGRVDALLDLASPAPLFVGSLKNLCRVCLGLISRTYQEHRVYGLRLWGSWATAFS